MRMTGQSVPQSKSGRSRPSVLVAKNHSPITRTIAPKIRDTFRPLSDAGGRQDWLGGGAAWLGGGAAWLGGDAAWLAGGAAWLGGGVTGSTGGGVGTRVVSGSVMASS